MSAHIKNAKMGTLQLPSPAMVNTHRPRSHVKTRRPRTYVPKRESLSMDTFLSNSYNKDVKRRLLCDLLSYCFYFLCFDLFNQQAISNRKYVSILLKIDKQWKNYNRKSYQELLPRLH